MADGFLKQIGDLWSGFRDKAADTAARQSAALVRGKTAAKDVFDDAGSLLIGAGQTVDEPAIERTLKAGRMGALVAAVVSATTQDLREHVTSGYERTQDGQEAKNFASSEEYLEARKYIRYTAAVEITDIRGHVLVPAGKIIEDEDVRAVREAGQLGALIYSAQQSGSPSPLQVETRTTASPVVSPPNRRTALPLAETFEPSPTNDQREIP